MFVKEVLQRFFRKMIHMGYMKMASIAILALGIWNVYEKLPIGFKEPTGNYKKEIRVQQVFQHMTGGDQIITAGRKMVRILKITRMNPLQLIIRLGEIGKVY